MPRTWSPNSHGQKASPEMRIEETAEETTGGVPLATGEILFAEMRLETLLPEIETPLAGSETLLPETETARAESGRSRPETEMPPAGTLLPETGAALLGDELFFPETEMPLVRSKSPR